MGFKLETSDSEYNVLPTVSLSLSLSGSTLQSIDHRLARFFSRNYRSFSLTLYTITISITISSITITNFKRINVGWEVRH